MIYFRCERCRAMLRGSEAAVGAPVTCARCGHATACPASSASAPVVAAPALPPARTWSSSFRLAIAAAALVLAAIAWSVWHADSDPSPVPAADLSPADRRQAEILELAIDNAPDPALVRLYDEINARHFGGRLPPMRVSWEPRLAEVGPLAARAFTLQGMFGHIGRKTVILLNPVLAGDPDALRRALSHEMVHVDLYARGQLAAGHGPEFRRELERLAGEGAFTGLHATAREREDLRAWLETEEARLQMEQDGVRRESDALALEAAELEAALARLNEQRLPPDDPAVRDWIDRRDAHNRRADELRQRAERNGADLAAYNREVDRYNLMLAYPDGFDEAPLLATRR